MLARGLRFSLLLVLALAAGGPARGAGWQETQEAGATALANGDLATAQKHLLEAYDEAVHFGPRDRRLLSTLDELTNLRRLRLRLGQIGQADRLAKAMIERAETARGPDHLVVIEVRIRVADADLQVDRWRRALEQLEIVRERALRALGPGDPRAVRALSLQVSAHLGLRNVERAAEIAAEARREADEALGPDHGEAGLVRTVQAGVAIAQGRLDEATTHLDAAIANRASWQAYTAVVARELAEERLRAGQPEAALRAAEQSLQVSEVVFTTSPFTVAGALVVTSNARLATGDWVGAWQEVRRAERLAERGPHALRAAVLLARARVDTVLGRIDEAAVRVSEATSLIQLAGPGATEAIGPAARRLLADLESRRGNHDRAIALFRTQRLDTSVRSGTESEDYAMALNGLGYALLLAGRTEEAGRWLDASMAIELEDPGARLARNDTLGLLHHRRGELDQARALFEEVLEGLPPRAPGRLEVLHHYRDTLRAQGDAVRAKPIEEEIAAWEHRQSEAIAAIAALPDETLGFVSEAFNFRLENGPAGWQAFDAKSINPLAIHGRLRGHPLTFFMVIPSEVGVDTFEDVSAIGRQLEASLSATMKGLEVRERGEVDFGGMEGYRLYTRARHQGQYYDWLVWSTLQNGVAYNFYLWSESGAVGPERLDRELAGFAERFHLLDPERIAGLPAEPMGRYRSERLGWSIELDDPRWVHWPEHPPFAETGGLLADDAAWLVVPVSFLGRDVAGADAEAALLALVDQQPRDEPERFRKDGFSGLRFEQPGARDDEFRFRVEIRWNERGAWLAMAWVRETADPKLLDVIDAIEIHPRDLVRGAEDLDRAERDRHGGFFNSVGLARFERGQTHAALEDLRLSAELHPSPAGARNLTHVLLSTGRAAEAVERLEAHPEWLEAHPDLLAFRALARREAGDPEGTLADYARAFELGFQDDEFFEDYAWQLWLQGRREEALSVLDAEIEETRSLRLRRVRARLRGMSGDDAAARAELVELAEMRPGDVATLYALVDLHVAAGRHSETLTVLDRVAAAEGESVETWHRRAGALVALGRHREAKTALEAAIGLDPAAERVREDLEHLSAMIGEGANTAIKRPIEPVALPPDAVREPLRPLPREAAEGFGAIFHERVIGTAWRRGGERRTTTREVIEIVDQSGVDAFSSFGIEFQPLGEEIFVNLLEVRDAEGRVVARGDASDYYVLDDVGEFATSGKKLHLPVPGVAPGRTIHLVYTLRDRGPPEQFRMLERTFSRTVPTARSEIYVLGDPDDLRWRTSQGVHERRFDGGILWTVSRPPAYRWEPLQGPYTGFLPWLLVGDATESWEKLGRDYLTRIDERLAPHEGLGSIVERELAGIDGVDERAARLHEYTRALLSYEAILFGRRAQVPNRVEDILERKYGDCKDHALLLHQLLERAGVRSHLVLVGMNRSVDPAVPSLDQFDHMIVFCADCTGGAWLDPTSKFWGRPGATPMNLAGTAALVLDPEAPSLAQIPTYRPEHHFVESERELELAENGGLVVNESLRLGGHAAVSLRALLAQVEAMQWKEAVRATYLQELGPVVVEEFRAEPVHDSRAPLRVDLRYRLRNAFTRSGSELVGRIPVPWERAFLQSHASAERATPFRLAYPIRLRSHVRIPDPAFARAPEDRAGTPREERGSFARWSSAAAHESGATVLEWELWRTSGSHPANAYGAFVDEMERSLSGIEAPLRFDAPSPPTP